MADDRLQQEYERQIRGVEKPTIAAIGLTGAGKTSLLNTLFGQDFGEMGHGRPITMHWQEYPPSNTCPIRLFDTKGIEPGTTASEEFEANTLGEIATLATGRDIANHIHVIVFVLDAAHGRLTDYDVMALNGPTLCDVPKVFAINKVDLASEAQIQACIDAVKAKRIRNVTAIVPTCANVTAGVSNHPAECAACSSTEFATSTRSRRWTCEECGASGTMVSRGHGLSELVTEIMSALPLGLKHAFIVSQQVNAKMKVEQSMVAVATATVACIAIGAAPIPIADIIAMTATQVSMVASLLFIWGHSPTDLTLMTGFTINQGAIGAAGKGLASLLKLIPGVGTIIGGIINATVGGTFTAVQGILTTVVLNIMFEKKILGSVEQYSAGDIQALWTAASHVMARGGLMENVRQAIGFGGSGTAARLGAVTEQVVTQTLAAAGSGA